MSRIVNFNSESAAPVQWAQMYRSLGLQVVPAMLPQSGGQWKRPALSRWKELESELVSDAAFDRWYGDLGNHAKRSNMGMICGACSGNVFVVDVDLHKNDQAQSWLLDMRDRQVRAGELDTVEQKTGGGGIQMLFRAPTGWIPPTCKTAIGVDIRGQGGFAMLPPSMHESGSAYCWNSNHEPWTIEIAEAPVWLCQEIDHLAKQLGGLNSRLLHSAPLDQSVNAFGKIVDGREDYATKMVWAAVVNEYRECPIKPASDFDLMKKVFDVYERKVQSRIDDPASSNSVLLEREGRGITMFKEKWNYAIGLWDTKVRDHAQADTQGAPQNSYLEVLTTPNRLAHFKGYPASEATPILSHRWLIKGVLPQKGLAIIYGAPGSGKSFFVADLVAHVSAPHKTHWRDKKAITGGVAYCFLEGGLGAQNRISAIKENIGDLGRFFSYPDSMNLSSAPLPPDESRPRVAECDAKRLVASILAQQGEVSVVVVDTFSRAMSGKDENSSTEMTSFIAAMDYIAKELDCLVVVVHHSGKDQSRGARGHSSLLGAIDTEIEITRPNKELPGRIAKLTKMKEGGDGHEFAFDLEKVTLGFDEDGEEVTTCIVVPAELDLTKSTRNKPYGPNEKVVLNSFETFLADHTDKYTPYGTGFPDRPERCVDLEAFKEFAVQRLPDSGKNKARKVRDAVASLTDRGMLAINGGLLWRVR